MTSTTKSALGPTTTQTAPKLEFDEATHTYSFDGRRVPSVTQILAGVGIIDTTWYAEQACTRGAYVAEATALLDRGILDRDSLDPVIRPYVEQWERFCADHGVEILEVERRVGERMHWYAGTLDRVVTFRADTVGVGTSTIPTLIDIKTGAREHWHQLQTAAYQAACKEHMRRGCLYLSENGYSWRSHSDRTDRHVFYAACAVHNWQQNKGKLPA